MSAQESNDSVPLAFAPARVANVRKKTALAKATVSKSNFFMAYLLVQSLETPKAVEEN
jgi:hypothetical protein